MVNVFDQTKHYSSISAVTYTFPSSGAQVINVGHMGLSQITVTNTAGNVTYAQGADFSVDRVNGVVAAIVAGLIASAALPIATSVQVSVPSVVVAPTVVAQVGAVGVPEVPAVVHRWVLPLESTIRFCDVYA